MSDADKFKILFADDSPDIRRIVRMIYHLRSGNKAVVVEAENGTEAIDRITSEVFDVVFLDYQMPPGNDGGIWAARKIKTSHPRLPIIFVSAYTQQSKLQSAASAGAVAYIAKEIVTQDEVITMILNQNWAGLSKIADNRGLWVFN
jgi:CheY-like chemotaxis protein